MAAVVRVKRHLDEEPLEALILSCKKRKLSIDSANNAENSELSTTVLKFAGTIKEVSRKDENVVAHLKKERIPEITELKEQFKKHSVNIIDKLREQMQETSKNNRYKVVNCFRSQGEDVTENLTSTSKKSEFTIFDIETDCGYPELTESESKDNSAPSFVYDLYYTNSDDFGDAEIEDYISVYPLSGPLMFDSTRDNRLNIADSEDDSEDSNAENYWRNDYPDESDLESINEEDMIGAMRRVDLDEDLLSSDEGEEGFVYSIDNEGEDLRDSDSYRYGESYAKFKAKNSDVTGSSVDDDFYCDDID